jgi:hypothetical protein
MSHESQSVSPVSLSCIVLTLLFHASHRIARVASISLVISLEQTSRAAFYGWVLEWLVVNRQGPPRRRGVSATTLLYAYTSGRHARGTHERSARWTDSECLCRAVASHKEELNGWSVDSGLCPGNWSLRTLRRWCSLKLHTVVVDTGGAPLPRRRFR